MKSIENADVEWCKEVKGNMYDMVVEGFQLLSRWTARVWTIARAAHQCLKAFFEATYHLSASLLPTSPMAIHKLYEMSKVFKEYRLHELLGPAVTAMTEVWTNYFYPMPTLYCYGFILDPRIRLEGLSIWLKMIGRNLELDYDSGFEETRESIFLVYMYYELKYGRLTPRELLRYTSSPAATSWEDAHQYRQQAGGSTSSPMSTPPDRNEMNLYLRAEFLDIDTNNLDLLQWWRMHASQFPILSIFSRDVLTVPVSSVSSEATFNSVGRVVDDRRSRLRPKLVKILTIVKDWERAKLNLPTELAEENADLVDHFNNWGINDDGYQGPQNPPEN